MIRTVVGFHLDDDEDWVAELSCGHDQHVRHRPPFRDRAWVQDAAGRDGRVGSAIACPLCDRRELPDGLVLVRRVGPWDQDTLPDGLLGTHRTQQGRWGRLRVLEGSVGFQLLEDGPGPIQHLGAGSEQPIPPEVPHRLVRVGPVRLELELWGRPP